MTLLSACLIVLNEEKNLGRCLASIAGVADEIVVVDTGSDDGTVAIAERHGARLFHHAWTNDYAAARNVSLAQAQGTFILYIDADEELHPEDTAALLALLGRGEVDAVEMRIVSPLGDGAMTNVSRYLRVFRNYPGVHFENAIHEQIWPALSVHQPRVHRSALRILHHGYQGSETELDAKRRRNLEGALRILEHDPDNAFYLYHTGLGHLTLSEPDKAIPWLERALRLANDDDERAGILNALAQAHYDGHDHTTAEQLAGQSIAMEPQQLHGHCLIADVLLLAQRHAQAIVVLRQVLNVTESRLHNDVSPDRTVLQLKLGMCELLTHDAERACETLQRAIASGRLGAKDLATAEHYLAMAGRMAGGDT